ncbi:MAG: 23S rRNA (pseudouridine(1915)-N(3))-methyltransferase RlmH [Chloroflexota bacterium]
MAQFSGKIQVVAVGKVKTKSWQLLQADYSKRIGRYVDFKLAEVKDSVGRGQPDSVAMQKEGEQLLKASSGANRLILLTENGRSYPSPQFATYLQKQLEIYGRLAFLIGGPVGFADAVRATAHDQLALSPMTFPHEMARVILLEQLYRAFTIRNREKYHK